VVLEATLRELLPDDIAARASGRVHVAVTRLAPSWTLVPFRPVAGDLISSFDSRDDFIAALLASCYIPFYFDRIRPGVRFRGAWCADGGITNFLPVPPSCARALRVTCFPAYSAAAALAERGNGKKNGKNGRNGNGGNGRAFGIDIAPDAPGPSGAATTGPYSVARLLQWALTPADDDVMNDLVHQGQADAQRWAARVLHGGGGGSGGGGEGDSGGNDGSGGVAATAVAAGAAAASGAAACAAAALGVPKPV
jgi:hypothetical protein